MAASKALPDRPSLESLRKQAKKLARDRSLSLRDAQLTLAREYGFAGWQDLTAAVSQRLGKGLEWAAAQARRIIHDNDVERLKPLLVECPALLSWHGKDQHEGGLLGMATGAYGDAGDAQREEWFTRGACAELLIDAGAAVMPVVCEGLLQSRARGLLELFHRKGVLPRTLKFRAALGDLDAVRIALGENARDLETINEAFVSACRFDREAVASLLLERSIALDDDLARHHQATTDRASFIDAFTKADFAQVAALGLWKVFVIEQVRRALRDRDLPAFVSTLTRERWLLGDAFVSLQDSLISTASFNDGLDAFIVALLDLDPAILRRAPPPPSEAISYAITYANSHLIPVLTRIWPLPDDLPHAAGMGNLSRVKGWFDESGAPALGSLDRHYPCNDPHARKHDDLHWGPPAVQHVLDTALAWAVINRHFEVADFLLDHGANINTNWNSHEPASILHHLVFLPGSYDSMRFLIDRGIDMSIEDYRWNATAEGWARYGKNDEKMAQWLADAERQRTLKP
jgi:hypothetical protein